VQGVGFEPPSSWRCHPLILFFYYEDEKEIIRTKINEAAISYKRFFAVTPTANKTITIDAATKMSVELLNSGTDAAGVGLDDADAVLTYSFPVWTEVKP